MKETKLQKSYRYYNRKYFDNSLPSPPEVKVKWGHLPSTEMGCFCGDEIVVSKKLRGSKHLWRGTLIHEMVHLKLEDYVTRSDHGKEFQAEMLELAQKGAFRNIW